MSVACVSAGVGSKYQLSAAALLRRIAVDELLPAAFGQHPRKDVMQRFCPLHGPIVAYALMPNLVYQTPIVDSDTELSAYTRPCLPHWDRLPSARQAWWPTDSSTD